MFKLSIRVVAKVVSECRKKLMLLCWSVDGNAFQTEVDCSVMIGYSKICFPEFIEVSIGTGRSELASFLRKA